MGMLLEVFVIACVVGLGVAYGIVFRRDNRVGIGRYAVGTWAPLFVGLYFLWGWVQVYVFPDWQNWDSSSSHVWRPEEERAAFLRELWWGAIICAALAIVGRTIVFVQRTKEPGRVSTYVVDVIGLGLVIWFAVYFLTQGLNGKLGLYFPGLSLVVGWYPAAALVRRFLQQRGREPRRTDA